MIRDGVLSDPPVEAIFGAHMVHTLPVGVMGLTPGAALAAFDRIEIHVTGKGGHAARPQSTVDPVVAASYLVTAIQSIVSRNINPLESAVLTIGSINAGNAFNVIPSSAVLVGTLRTLSGEVREIANTRIREMSERVAAAFGAAAEVEIEEGYPIMLNDPDTTAFLGARAPGGVGGRTRQGPPAHHGVRGFRLLPGAGPGDLFPAGMRQR